MREFSRSGEGLEHDDVQGLGSGCREGHHDREGICSVCGAWLPRAWCRVDGCKWEAASGEASLRLAVEHQLNFGHDVRVVVGGYVEDDEEA